MLRRLLLPAVILLLVCAGTARADDGPFVVLSGVAPDDAYYEAAVRLAKHHRTKHLLAFDLSNPQAIRDRLRELAPAHVADRRAARADRGQ